MEMYFCFLSPRRDFDVKWTLATKLLYFNCHRKMIYTLSLGEVESWKAAIDVPPTRGKYKFPPRSKEQISQTSKTLIKNWLAVKTLPFAFSPFEVTFHSDDSTECGRNHSGRLALCKFTPIPAPNSSTKHERKVLGNWMSLRPAGSQSPT